MQNNICKVSCKYKNKTHTYSVQFRPSVVSDSLRPHVLQHTRPPRPVTNSRSPPKPMSIESVMPSSHLILCRPLLLLPSVFPSTRVFSNESVLINTQHKRSKRSLSTCIFLPVDVHWSQRCLWERPSFVPRLCTWANPCLHV